MREAGVQGVEIGSWTGLLAPGGTPPEIINRLQSEIAKIVNLPDVKERFAGVGMEPVGNTSKQFAAMLTAESATWGNVVRATNFKVE